LAKVPVGKTIKIGNAKRIKKTAQRQVDCAIQSKFRPARTPPSALVTIVVILQP